jgi:hypothetical protein
VCRGDLPPATRSSSPIDILNEEVIRTRCPASKVLRDWPQVLTEMLDMLRDHLNNSHTAFLEWVVIWLIVIEVVVGLFECASILGWVGHEHV